MKKIFIVTGEYSGDVHAAKVVRELKALGCDLQIEGIGGIALENEGVKLFKPEEHNEPTPLCLMPWFRPSFPNIQKDLKHEIENAQYCSYCHGTGEIVDYEVIEEEESCGFERLPLKRFYKKEKCKTCNGTGEIHYN